MENKKIEIRSYCSGWREVPIEKAREYIKGRIKRIGYKPFTKNLELAGRHLRGITIEELFEGTEDWKRWQEIIELQAKWQEEDNRGNISS